MAARLAEAVLRDERAVLPVAAYSSRYEVTLSLVSVLGAGGVRQMHEPAMTSDERAALERSDAPRPRRQAMTGMCEPSSGDAGSDSSR